MNDALPSRSCAPGLVSVEQAREVLLGRARRIEEAERVAVEAALGRVVALSQRAEVDVPGYDNSAMDGYALRSADAAAAGRVRLRVTQRVAAGQTGGRLGEGEAARIFTGAAVPEGADAVVMQEDCEADGEHVWLTGPVAAGAHVRPRGNDIRRGGEILAPGMRIRPQEMGLAASVGLSHLDVVRRPRVAVFSSGDELVAPGVSLAPGQIYNSNRYTLHGLLAALGCEVQDLGTVADSLAATREALERAARDADLVLTTGGVSVGEEDHVRDALEEVGRIEMWRIAVKPGKPLAFGAVGEVDFIGLPGNPVSTLVGFCLFVRPYLLARLGVPDPLPRSVPVEAGFDWPRPAGRREFARARLERREGASPRAVLFARQGSDVLSSTAWADGLVEVPEGTTVATGDRLEFYLFSELF